MHRRVETYYKDRLEEAWQGRHPMKGLMPGPRAIQMRSNDYLCLAGDLRIINAEIMALEKSGHGNAVSRVWLHHEKDAFKAFEERVAHLMQAEDALICPSGYCANLGLLQSIAAPDTPVYLDMMAHMSLWEGVVSARATPRPVRHNSPEHLARQISRYGAGIVVVDALYSTDGDLAPLREIAAVCEKHGCVLVVDETHSFGTHGQKGGGLVVEHGLADQVHFRTIGLSKAVASRGGMIVGSKRNIEFLRYESLPNIFSTSVLAHEIAGYDAALDIFAQEPWRRKILHANHSYLVTALDRLGYNVTNCKSQIISLEAGNEVQTTLLRDALERRNVFGSVYLPPATPKSRCFIRFTLNCGLSRKQLDHVITVCKDIREEIGMWRWPSTRRKLRSNKHREHMKIKNFYNLAS